MKFVLSFLFLVIVFSCVSCVMAKTYKVEEKKMRIENENVFVIKTNGEKVSGKKIATPSVFNGGADWIKIGRQKFQFDELTAYQDHSAYYCKFGPIWVKQLKRGKINLFYYEVVTPKSPSNGNQNQYDEHFVFQKGDGKILELSSEAISEMLKDNMNARAKFDAQFKPGKVIFPKQLQNHPKALFEIIDMYNSGS